MNGDCNYTNLKNESYIGQCKNGKFHGYGNYTSKDGNRYVGIFENGKKHGSGIYTTSLYTFEGKWQYDKLQGLVILKDADGKKYLG